MTDSPCPRLGKIFGGCKFEPRYDTVKGHGGDTLAFFHGAQPTPDRTTYICDVCVTCGKMLFKRKSVPKSDSPK